MKRAEVEPLGRLVRKRREELGESLVEASRKLRVVPPTLILWERGKRQPGLKAIPEIVRYLGYDPLGNSGSLASRLRMARLRRGMSRVAVARHLGMSVHAYERWEDGRISLARVRSRRLLEGFIREEEAIGDSQMSLD